MNNEWEDEEEHEFCRKLCNLIVRINEEYYDLSGMWLTDSGAEGFMNALLAREIGVLWREHSRGKNGYVLVEQPLKDLGKSARQKRRSEESEQPKRSRFDIALWSESEDHIVLFEGKRGLIPQRIEADITKMYEASKIDKRVYAGISGVFTYGEASSSNESTKVAYNFVTRHMEKLLANVSHYGRNQWIATYGAPLQWDHKDWSTPVGVIVLTHFMSRCS